MSPKVRGSEIVLFIDTISRTFHSSESLTAQPRISSDLTLSIFVPNKGCNGTYCVESEEYPDPGRILDILDSEGFDKHLTLEGVGVVEVWTGPVLYSPRRKEKH